jgi:alkylated DNA repair dioxygenase AlkB
MEYNTIKITEDYVDKDFEDNLMNLIPNLPQISKERNQILRWGNPSPYPDNIVSKSIPDLFNRFKKDIDFDSVTVNEYYPGQRINWHIDFPIYLEKIFIISLLSDADLKFRNKGNIISYKLPRFSLVEFSDDLRYKWEHSLVAPEKRYSVVFRKSKK